jgi:hypothetical protein
MDAAALLFRHRNVPQQQMRQYQKATDAREHSRGQKNKVDCHDALPVPGQSTTERLALRLLIRLLGDATQGIPRSSRAGIERNIAK